MKGKVALILFFIVILLGNIPKLSFAVSSTPSPFVSTNSQINSLNSNFNCGDPYAAGDARKCCKPSFTKPAPIDFGNPALNSGQKLLQPLIDKSTNSIMQQQKSIEIKPCTEGVPSTPGDINNDSCICIIEPTKIPLAVFETMCANIKSPSEQTQCKDCSHNKSGVWTAMGCFESNISEFIANSVMKTGMGIAGGISLLCIMFAAFQMQTSAGNAEKVKKAQELMTNCITGLMVIIFSILILKIIGVDILRIPGFY